MIWLLLRIGGYWTKLLMYDCIIALHFHFIVIMIFFKKFDNFLKKLMLWIVKLCFESFDPKKVIELSNHGLGTE